LIIGPVGGGDPLGYLFAGIAAVGCALYYVIAARPAHGLPPVALGAFGLLLGAASLGLVGATGLVPFVVTVGEVAAAGVTVPWWLPLLVLGGTTAVGYATGIAASQLLGSRLMSFVGMLEVVFASLFAWITLGEALGLLQFVGGALILVGIALVKAEKVPEIVDELPIPGEPVATRS
jgi:drug/metabolite transporter (DMT)-like permease